MEIRAGYPTPLGCKQMKEGVNFALFSEHATAVRLCLFNPHHNEPFLEVALDPKIHKTGWIWHVYLCDLPKEVEYGYRLEGPYDPEKGLLFNPRFLVTDPYARSLNTTHRWKDESLEPERYHPKSRLINGTDFDWEKTECPCIPIKDLIIYEMHVRAFTCDHSSKASHPGTFLAVIDKIPHLKKLGVNAIELLPVHEFNERENPLKNPLTQQPLCNFWGYSTVNFFSPMNRYASSSKWEASIIEFKTMVRELHRNGIEVILDVVYNHTAEQEHIKEKYYSFKGIDNSCYYLLDKEGAYLNFSGCGNTFNCNHPVAAQLILDSLRYWASEMHIDGFRFDLASILTRDVNGQPLEDPPLIKAISNDPVLSKTKLIAEPWDAAGLYQVGNFPGGSRWSEWNGKYRDSVRCFIKGTDNYVGEFARSLCGSEDLYGDDKKPFNSINFITAHDGYSLRDLVSYQDKHNEGNGEANQDGMNDNASWNCGVEGTTKNKHILKLRAQQMRNFHLALMLSVGTPMLLMGDEYGHTRKGNNNVWSQDNILNWFLWHELEKAKDYFRFHCLVNAFRKNHACFKREDFLTTDDIDWHGHLPFEPDWSPTSRFLAYTLKDGQEHEDLYVAFNAHFEEAKISLPELTERKKWFLIVDTSLSPPEDFREHPKEHPPLPSTYSMPPHSALLAKAL